MANQLHTGIYHMDIRNFDYEVAHIYEHMVIMTFVNNLENHGFSKYLYGWISGETYRSTMFINYAFYDPEVEAAFEKFMRHKNRIDLSLLDVELLRIQAEVKQVVMSIDRSAFDMQLEKLDQTTFINHKQAVESEYMPRKAEANLDSNVVKLRRSSRQFRNITALFEVANLSLDERVAFLRMAPFIHDYSDSILCKVGAYGNDWGATLDRPNGGMIGLDIYALRRGGPTAREIQLQLQRDIWTLIEDIKHHPKQLQNYIDGYLHTPDWDKFAIQYYKWSGILTSKQNVAKVLTQKNIVSILSRLQFKVESTKPEHWDAT